MKGDDVARRERDKWQIDASICFSILPSDEDDLRVALRFIVVVTRERERDG